MSFFRSSALIILALVSINSVLASEMYRDGDEPDLCEENEKVLFNCGIGSKYLSLCSSKDLSPSTGYISYRFGELDKKPELEYPTDNVMPKDAFVYSYNPYAKGNSIQLSFSMGQYTYTVDVQSHVYRPDWYGVVVEKESEISSRLKCDLDKRRFGLMLLDDLGFTVHRPRDLGTSPK